MTKSNADKVPRTTTHRSPFTDITNSSTIENANVTTNSQQAKKNTWYARLSDEKRAAFLEKRRMSRQEKKAQSLNIITGQLTPEAHASLGSKECTPLSNITNTHTNDARCTGDSTATVQHSEDANVGRKRTANNWYARLTDEQRAEHLHKLRLARLQKKVVHDSVTVKVPHSSYSQSSPGSTITVPTSESTCLPVARHRSTTATGAQRQPSAGEAPPGITHYGSAQSSITRVEHTLVGEPNTEDNDSDHWLHRNPTYARGARSAEHNDFVPTSFIFSPSIEPQDSAARYEKERIRKRTKYSEMSTDQRDALLYRVREYKKRKRTTCASSDQNDHAGVCNIDEDSDVAGIFEPMRPDVEIEENMDTSQEGETVYDDDDEESRRFSAQGNDFESYRVTTDGAYAFETHDPYDYVYHNLPTKHHVLKPVKDCIHCGAIRFQYEGPAFCCRKGKVKVFIPEVPQELQRLFSSQVDEDAKYFRQHIRYFNSHFSFTSLGVTLDKRVNTVARTGVYTFRAHGQLYHRLDHLLPGDHGPRHLQLYIYDTDEALEHRMKRSPDLDINLIRKILRILENNPYVETFKSLGSVPDLAEYKITLNTNIKLDQRWYNAPTASQVAAMWVEGTDPQHTFDRSVIVHAKGDRPLYIRAYYGCYDPLAYPLFYPVGETGWNRWLPYEGPTPAQAGNEDEDDNQDDEREADDNEEQDEDESTESRKYVSAREYYCFKLQIREGVFNILLFGGRLLQQWLVDMYIKMETMRLDFYSKPQNQKLIRAELYQVAKISQPHICF
ncbi:hypothetical protein ACQJBY_061802 [Aegilops geniculata]